MICKSKKIKIIALEIKLNKLQRKRARELGNLAESNPGKFSRTDFFENNFPDIFKPIDSDIEKTARLIKFIKNKN